MLLRCVLIQRNLLDNIGIDLHSTRCLVCDDDQETEPHLFLHCKVALQLWNEIAIWWNLKITSFNLLQEVIGFVDSLYIDKGAKCCIDVVFQICMCILWSENGSTFNKSKPKSVMLGEDVKLFSFLWIDNRNRKFNLNLFELICNLYNAQSHFLQIVPIALTTC